MELYINNQLCDVTNSDSIEIDYSIADVNSITTRTASCTRTIELPWTARNLIALGFPGEVTAWNVMNNNTQPKAILYDGVDLLRGYVKVIAVTINKSIEIVIFSDNGDWKTQLQNIKLIDLDLSEYDHSLASVILQATWYDGSPYLYPIVNLGNEEDTGNPAGNTTFNPWRYKYPAINILMLLMKCINTVGYKIADNDYSPFMLSIGDFLNRCYMYHLKSFKDNPNFTNKFAAGLSANKSLASLDAYYVSTIGYDDTTNSIWYDNGSVFNTTTSHFIAANDIIAMFVAGVKIKLHQDLNRRYGISIDIRKYNTSTPVYGEILESSAGYTLGPCHFILEPPFISDEYLIIQINTAYISLAQNDHVFCVIKVINISDPPCDETIENLSIVKDFNSKFFNICGAENPVNTVELKWFLPDISCLQFIQSLRDKFNLYFETNTKERTIFIRPRDDFFSGTVIDWTSKADISKDIKLTYPDKPKKLIFADKSDSGDALAEAIKPTFGQYTKEFDTVFSTEERKIESIFAPTVMDYAVLKGITDIRIPTMLKELPNGLNDYPEASTDFETRLFYYAGNVNLSAGSLYALATIPECYSYNEDEGNENNLLYTDMMRSYGCVNKYFRNELQTINDGVILSMYFKLNLNDIALLSFRYYIKYKDDYFILNKIKSYNTRTSCLVELIKLCATAVLPEIYKDWSNPEFIAPSGTLSHYYIPRQSYIQNDYRRRSVIDPVQKNGDYILVPDYHIIVIDDLTADSVIYLPCLAVKDVTEFKIYYHNTDSRYRITLQSIGTTIIGDTSLSTDLQVCQLIYEPGSEIYYSKIT